MISVKKVLQKLASNFNDSGWIALNANVKYRKIGKIVYVSINSNASKSIAVDVGNNIGTMPEGYRPNTGVAFVCTPMGGSQVITTYIEPNGVILLYTTGNTSYWKSNFTYTID